MFQCKVRTSRPTQQHDGLSIAKEIGTKGLHAHWTRSYNSRLLEPATFTTALAALAAALAGGDTIIANFKQRTALAFALATVETAWRRRNRRRTRRCNGRRGCGAFARSHGGRVGTEKGLEMNSEKQTKLSATGHRHGHSQSILNPLLTGAADELLLPLLLLLPLANFRFWET